MTEVNHPKHYNQYPVEVIDMMIRIFGEEQTRTFCLLNAFKYRMRVGHKDDTQSDLAKEQWYLDKAKELSLTFQERIDIALGKDCSPIDVINEFRRSQRETWKEQTGSNAVFRPSTVPGDIKTIAETETGY